MKSKLAIWSFVLSLIGAVPLAFFLVAPSLRMIPLLGILFRYIQFYSEVFILTGAFTVLPLFILAGFITSIISLATIKRAGLDGKKLAWASFIISIIGVILNITLIGLIANSAPWF